MVSLIFYCVNNKTRSGFENYFNCYCSCVMLRKPFGAMVSSPDQTPQVPFMFFLIIHYFERPAPSVRLVKSIHLRALPQILDAAMFETCVFANCNETTSMNDFVDEPNFAGACYVSEQYCI